MPAASATDSRHAASLFPIVLPLMSTSIPKHLLQAILYTNKKHILPLIQHTILISKLSLKNRRSAATIQRMLHILLEWFALSQFLLSKKSSACALDFNK
jgi:hypothetical protein